MHLGDKEGPGQVPCSMIETKEAFVAAQSTELPISRDSNSEDSENVFEGVGKNMNENDQWMELVLDKNLKSDQSIKKHILLEHPLKGKGFTKQRGFARNSSPAMYKSQREATFRIICPLEPCAERTCIIDRN